MTIPARMHFPYALRVAKRGFAIRRLSWTDKWWVWRSGVMVQIEDGESDHVVLSTDYEAEDLLSWDWTTLKVGCESADGSTDLAELLTVRPYDGLPTAPDPLSRGCALPDRAETIEPEGWPVFGLPRVDKRRVQFSRPPFTAPPLPTGEEWKPGRVKRKAAPNNETPLSPLSITFTRPINSATFGSNKTWASPSSLEWGATTADQINISGLVTISGGVVGASYIISIGFSNSTTSPTNISSPLFGGTMGVGENQAWTTQPWYSSGNHWVAIGDVVPFALYYERVGGGASGWVTANIYVPSDLPGS